MSVPPELLKSIENPGWTDFVTAKTGELKVRNFTTFFNHFFAEIPEGEGLSGLRFATTTTDGSVDRDGQDAQVSTNAVAQADALLETRERANYAPGAQSIAGIAVELPNGLPTGAQDVHFGMTNDTNGYGAGIKDFGIGEGTPGATSPGVQPYVFIDVAGTRTRVPQEHWNLDTLDGSNDANNPSGAALNNFETGNIIRLDHLYYGKGELDVDIGVYQSNRVEFHSAHAFTPDDQAMIEQPNVPMHAHVENNATAQTLDLNVRAVHYERLTGEADFRVNGETRRGQDVDSSWEPLISWQKRDNWEQVNVRPVAVTIASDTDLALDIQLDPSLNGASFGSPTHTSSSEHAVDVDTSATGFSSTGERRWIGQVSGGQGSRTGTGSGDLEFNLPADQIATLAAKADADNATVDAVVLWGSEF